MTRHSTSISWTHRPGTQGKTWNPIRARNRETGKVGWFCVHVSEGCKNCYAETWNGRRGNGVAYRAQDREKVEVYLDEKTLVQPLRWRKPRTIFVCSMSDLYGEWVTEEWLDRIYAVMALTPHHTFQVLTKRAERQREYLATLGDGTASDQITRIACDIGYTVRGYRGNAGVAARPLPNVWAGVSVEDQKTADERIPTLLETPAAIRFVSYEPALEYVDFTRLPVSALRPPQPSTGEFYDVEAEAVDGKHRYTMTVTTKPRLHQILIGGESGPGARPFDLGWARKTIADCKAAGVACFVKQLGRHPWEVVARSEHVEQRYYFDLRDKKGAEPAEWPEDLRVQEFPGG